MATIKRNDLTLDVLKEYLHYCPTTGDFTYLKKTGKKSVVGNKVGSISKSDGHLEIRFFGTLYRAHRLAWFYMTGEWPKYIDHIDHDELNNKWENLRNVSQQTNNMNQPKRCDNTSGYTGVWWHNQCNRWTAEIMFKKVKHNLGTFKDINDAIRARKEAEKRFGFHENHGKP